MNVHASAPTSILEIGSWTDTAAAEHGSVLSCTVAYYAHASVSTDGQRRGISLHGSPACAGRLDALFHALARHFGLMNAHARLTMELDPEGEPAMLASAAVALAGATARLAGQRMMPHRVAALAHDLFSQEFDIPFGVHRYVAAALGGVTQSRVSPFPRAFAQRLMLSPEVMDELEDRLLLVDTGRVASPELYRQLELRCESADLESCGLLWRLRSLPWQAVDALDTGDFTTLGSLMARQTRWLQQYFHSIATPEARRIDLLACRYRALGIGTNAAGSQLLILAELGSRPLLAADLESAGFRVLPVRIDRHGLRVWVEEEQAVPAPLYLLKQAA